MPLLHGKVSRMASPADLELITDDQTGGRHEEDDAGSEREAAPGHDAAQHTIEV